jgi:hypothetical protein
MNSKLGWRISDDTLAALLGLLFALTCCGGMVLLQPFLQAFELRAVPPDDSGFFYDWQRADPGFWSRVTCWGGYFLHQVLHWATIAWAKQHYKKPSATLRPLNYVALAINVIFIGLHFLQTAFFYDGFAQDIPSWTAQYAVIVMLVMILAMENRRRGLFFGHKLSFRTEFYRWLREYHGYVFSFAVIYTFWFHPLVDTWGHLLGFAQVILILVQGSLMFTLVHQHRGWTFLLEILVLPHAAIVAYQQGNQLIFMFVFGFLLIFVMTQMHGFNWPTSAKLFCGLLFVASIVITYCSIRSPSRWHEILRVPLIEYFAVIALYALWQLFLGWKPTRLDQ